MNLDRLSDQDLDELVDHYNDFAGNDALPVSWRGWYANLGDLLQVERARRRIEQAWQRDPMAMAWFGRLEPGGPGASGSQTKTT